ncbi:MAG: IS66 family insertion sequence element accessory protein TnpB [Pseudanabaena sp. SU_2_4]|nr:IS66 family insertion sequence element accessory protein TnpB [Pseudanabaena sp. SU_2_4]NKB17339.1 IS66 family insertion sequence element accessory protein TnpB [Pseudanabaena sp. CRU_2_10]
MLVPLNVGLYVSRDPADFRKQSDGLCGLVRNCLGREPSDQCLYIFFNRRRDQVKIVYYSPGGYCLWWKRLESGSFAGIDVEGSLPYVTITSTELLDLLGNKTVSGRGFPGFSPIYATSK